MSTCKPALHPNKDNILERAQPAESSKWTQTAANRPLLSLETQSLNSSGYKRVESHRDRWRTMWKSREITGCPHTRAQTRLPLGDFKVLSLEYMHEAILNHSWSAKPLAIEMEFVCCTCRLDHVDLQTCFDPKQRQHIGASATC